MNVFGDCTDRFFRAIHRTFSLARKENAPVHAGADMSIAQFSISVQSVQGTSATLIRGFVS